jgi:hypothetical protein
MLSPTLADKLCSISIRALPKTIGKNNIGIPGIIGRRPIVS